MSDENEMSGHTKGPWDVRFDLGNPDGSQWSVLDAIGFFIADYQAIQFLRAAIAKVKP